MVVFWWYFWHMFFSIRFLCILVARYPVSLWIAWNWSDCTFWTVGQSQSTQNKPIQTQGKAERKDPLLSSCSTSINYYPYIQSKIVHFFYSSSKDQINCWWMQEINSCCVINCSLNKCFLEALNSYNIAFSSKVNVGQ